MTRRRPVVAVTRTLADSRAENLLRERAEVVELTPGWQPEELFGVDGLIAVWPSRVTAEHLDAADALQVVATVTAGCDHVDLDAAQRREVRVVTGVGAGSNAVAEYVLWALIGLSRNLHDGATMMSDPTFDWATRLAGRTSRELHGRRLGLVGFGFIGQEVARLASAFGMQILVHDPAVSGSGPYPQLELHELLEASDAVSLHVPLTASTRAMIGAEELAALGRDGLLVNAARGGVVDEAALLAALRRRCIGGVATDVFETEPAPSALLRELARHANVLMTPHLAGFSDRAAAEMCRRAVDAVTIFDQIS